MSIRLKDAAKKAEKTLSNLKGKVLLVEGKHDVKALKSLGLEAKQAHGPSPWRWAETHGKELQDKEVVLLFDFDAEGERKNEVFSEALSAVNVFPNRVLRRRLKRVFGVSTMEELPTRFGQILEKGETDGKNVRGYGKILDKSELRSGRHNRKA